MKIISISGLDGSGKSTQIELLKRYLESQGKRVFYFHAIKFSIANKLRQKSNNNQKSVTSAGWFSVQLRKIFLRFDLCRFKNLVKKLGKEGYNYLVSDRYFYDSVINIKYLSNCDYDNGSILKPDVAIYLKSDPSIIMQREQKPDQGIDYLQKKYELYNKSAGKWDLKIIDGNKSKEKIFENIKKLLEL